MLLYSGTKDGISGCREVSYVLHLCYNGGCSFFSLERKERTKEKLEKALTLGILKRACGYTH